MVVKKKYFAKTMSFAANKKGWMKAKFFILQRVLESRSILLNSKIKFLSLYASQDQNIYSDMV